MIGKLNRWAIVALFVLLISAMACNLPGRLPSGQNNNNPSTPDMVEKQPKITENSGQQPDSSAEVTIVMDEAQLNALITEELQKQEQAVLQDANVRLLDGQIQVTAQAEQSGMRLPLEILMQPTADEEGKPNINIVSGSLGPLPLPESLLDQLSAQLDSLLDHQINTSGREVFIEDIHIENGVMEITGHAR